MATSVMDLVLFHAMEVNLYIRLVRTMGASPEVTKQVLSLWLWMESIGYPQLVSEIYIYNDNALRRVVAEGEACLKALHPDMDPPENNDIPITASLAKEPINLRFFRYNRDAVIQGIANVLNKVCKIIFDENVIRVVEKDARHPTNPEVFLPGFNINRPAGEGTSRQAMQAAGFGGDGTMPMMGGGDQSNYQAILASAAAPLVVNNPHDHHHHIGNLGMEYPSPSSLWSSELNPFASPWTPSIGEERLGNMPSGQEPEDERSMFLTFSRGYPLTKEDVVEFFTSQWGNCIDKVSVEKPLRTEPPMFGRVVFKSASVIPLILEGQQKAKFVVKGKHLWVRMYVPRNM